MMMEAAAAPAGGDSSSSMSARAPSSSAAPPAGEEQQLDATAATAAADKQQLLQMLCKSEAQRLRLQQQAAGLVQTQQALTADARLLRSQLADAHAAFAESQQQLLQLSDVGTKLTLQVKAATAEYRGNDIICIGLRSTITSLTQQLQDSRSVCVAQSEQLACSARDTDELRQRTGSLGQALEQLQVQHGQLLEQHGALQQEHEQAARDMQSMRTRWQDMEGNQAKQLHDAVQQLQQLEAASTHLSQQLHQEQRQRAAADTRCTELDGELLHVRELVMLLGKSLGRLPSGQALPAHDDPVWQKPGPLGGVAHTLNVAMRAVRDQHARVRELQAACDQLQDSVRAEAAQKAGLQAELYDVRTTYAKAVGTREALEARTARAEAEKAAAESSLGTVRGQAAVDVARASELQQEVLALTQRVRALEPLPPKLEAAEVERDTAQHALQRLQELHDKLQRQLDQAVRRETAMAAEVAAYAAEHGQLLSANAQLVEQCAALNKQVQLLEVSVREAKLAGGQLEEARCKLQRTKTQLQALTERHTDTVSRLNTTEQLLATQASAVFSCDGAAGQAVSQASSPSGCAGRSRPSSAWGGRNTSRPGTAHTLPARATAANTRSNSAVQWAPLQQQLPQQQQQTTCEQAADSVHQASSTGAEAGVAGPGAGPADGSASPPSPRLQQQQPQHVEDDGAAAELEAMLRHTELQSRVAAQQQAMQELQQQLGQQRRAVAQLELRLLQQEAVHLQEMRTREAAVADAWSSAADEATGALAASLASLQRVLAGPTNEPDNLASTAAAAAPQPLQAAGPHQARWLPSAVATLLGNMKLLVDDAKARAAAWAARQSVGTQSDEPAHAQWLRCLASLPDGVVAQPLSLKAAEDAIVRIYFRGLTAVEQSGSSISALAAASTHPSPVTGLADSAHTLFSTLMQHYGPPTHANQQQQAARRVAMQPCNPALWQDPNGPMTRLLISCRALAPASIKVALFACLAGTQRPACSTQPWQEQHYQQLLLLLHAVKRLAGGLWKGVLRDWASPAGAALPLQCVGDLLGNVFNVASLAALEQKPALLGACDSLLQALQALPEASSSTDGGGGCRALQPGSVADALQELLADGPLGPGSAVDLDALLAMLLVQFDAGLLPSHPLLQPRRLTTGSLGNMGNAWGGSTAGEAAGTPTSQQGGPRVLAGEASDWALPSPLSSSAGGWLSSRTTTAATTTRLGTAAGGSSSRPQTSCSQVAAGGAPGRPGVLTLPRLRTPPDDAPTTAGSSSPTGGLPRSPGAGVLKCGLGTARAVAFRE